MQTLSELYMNSFGKVLKSDPMREDGYFYPQKDFYKREQNDENSAMAADNPQKKERNVSASIEVPNSSRRHHVTTDEHSMEDLMAAMVLSNMPYNPMFNPHFKGASPGSYDSSGVGSWTQDSRRTSPFLPSVRHPGLATPKHEEEEEPFVVWQKSRTPDNISDTDPGTILLQRSTPNPDAESTSKNEAMDEEAQDFSMKTLRAKEEEEKLQEAVTKQKVEQQKATERFNAALGQYAAALHLNGNSLVPPPIPFPYYMPNPMISHPYSGSVPNELLLLRLAASSSFKPLPNTELLGSSAPGHIESKLHRLRPSPYNKVSDDSAISSPMRSLSPAMQPFGSAPAAASYRLGLPNSGPIPVSQLSFSPTRHRKMTRSPRPQCSPYSSPSHAPRVSSLSLPKDGAMGMKGSRDFYHQHTHNGYGPSSLATKAKPTSWNSGAHFVPNRSFQTKFNSKANSAVATNPVPIPFGRKIPGDGKKCRKVYGMENKDQWCTACKWKKACQRFPD